MKLIPLMLAVCLALPALAQDPAKTVSPTDPPKFYKLDFVVREVEDGKVISTKSYSTSIVSDDRTRGASIRTGNRVPFNTGAGYQYADIGVNIDCQQARELGPQLVLTIIAEISSVPGNNEPVPNQLPMVRQNKWNSVVLVPIGKATTVFSSDDLNSKRKMQLEVTATPIK